MFHDAFPLLISFRWNTPLGRSERKEDSESNSSSLCQQWVQRDLDQVLSSFDVQSFHCINDVLFVCRSGGLVSISLFKKCYHMSARENC